MSLILSLYSTFTLSSLAVISLAMLSFIFSSLKVPFVEALFVTVKLMAVYLASTETSQAGITKVPERFSSSSISNSSLCPFTS